MVKEPLMLVYKLHQSAVRLSLLKKLRRLSCSTTFSNCHWAYIGVTDHKLSLDKLRTISLRLRYGQNWSIALLVLKIPKKSHWLQWSLLFPLLWGHITTNPDKSARMILLLQHEDIFITSSMQSHAHLSGLAMWFVFTACLTSLCFST